MTNAESQRKFRLKNIAAGRCRCGRERAFLSSLCQRCLDLLKKSSRRQAGKQHIKKLTQYRWNRQEPKA